MERRRFVKTVLGGAAVSGLVGTAAGDRLGGASDPLAEIEILTDEYGESHVYADSLYALGFGNGYVQARDRLFLLDAVRHIGRGDSAAILGPGQIPSDVQVRRDLYGPDAIQQQWEDASETIREAIRGYADGVNRKMTELAASGELPGIFAALGHAPEPWEPTDSVAAINYLIGFFGVSGGDELSNAKTLDRLVESLGDEAGAWEAYGDLNWLRTTDDHYTSIPGDDLVVEGGETVLDYDEVSEAQLGFVRDAAATEPWGIETDVTLPDAVTEGRREAVGLFEGFKWGSNAIVTSGELTETGKPMLGGGPQMGYFKPPIPYEIGLHGAGYDASGIGVVGAPALVIGRTETLAWTVTSGRDDQVDTVAVELDPEDRHRYRWKGDWHRMETETVVHRASPVAPTLGGEPETRVVEQEVARIEQNGTSMPVVAWNPEEDVAFCQRVTTRADELEGAFMWAEVGRADDLDDFEARLTEFPFTFNFHVIEHDHESGESNVAFLHTGKVPDRNPDLDLRFPQPSDDHYWNGTRSGTGLGTNDRNPSTGYYVNWNNGPVTGWRAGDSEQNWGSHHRVEVLDHFTQQLLDETGDELSLDDVTEIIELAARHDSTANASIDHFIHAGKQGSDGQLGAMADELEAWADSYCEWDDGEEDEWNGDFSESERDEYVHAGVAIWEEVRREVQALAFEELGDQNYEPDWSPDPSLHADEHGNATDDVTFIDALAGDTAYDWFDETPGDGQRDRDEAIREAMRRAAATLTERFETDQPADWLRPEHKSVFTVIGAVQGEAFDMVNRATYQHAVAIGEGLDATGEDIADFSGDALPPANSGHVSADELATYQATGEEPDRVDDQLELYADFDYKPHPITREQVESLAVSTETIRASPASRTVPIEPGRDLLDTLVDVPADDEPPAGVPSLLGGDPGDDSDDGTAEDGGTVDDETADGDGGSTDDDGGTDGDSTADDGDTTDPVEDATATVGDELDGL